MGTEIYHCPIQLLRLPVLTDYSMQSINILPPLPPPGKINWRTEKQRKRLVLWTTQELSAINTAKMNQLSKFCTTLVEYNQCINWIRGRQFITFKSLIGSLNHSEHVSIHTHTKAKNPNQPTTFTCFSGRKPT